MDGYGAFRQTYLNVDRGELLERVDRLVAQGRAVGLTFVLTADRRNAVPTTLSSAITERLVLRMAEGDEYASLGLPTALAEVTLAPGRGFLKGTEVQIGVLGADATGPGQAQAIEGLAAAVQDRLAARTGPAARLRPPPVEPLPDRISLRTVTIGPPTLAAVPFGVSGDSYRPMSIDLVDNPVFGALGPARSGRTTALHTVTAGLVAAQPGVEAYLLAPRRTALLDAPWWREVGRGVDGCDTLARKLEDVLRERQASGAGPDSAGPDGAGAGSAGGIPPWLVVVDDGDELVDTLGANSLVTLVRRGRDLGLVLVVALQTHTAHRAFGGWVTEIRKAKHAIVLDPAVDIDGDLFGVRFPRKASRRFPAGRGYLVTRGPVDYVQVACPD